MCYNQNTNKREVYLMNLIELHRYAEINGVVVNYRKIDAKKACVMKLRSRFHILLNKQLIKNESDERIVLAHELGHCENNQLYYLNNYSNPMYIQNVLKAERLSSDYACMLLVNIDELKRALREYDNEFAAAESLNLDILKFREIVDCYQRKGFLPSLITRDNI